MEFDCNWHEVSKDIDVVNKELSTLLQNAADDYANGKVLKAEYSYGDVILSNGQLMLPKLTQSENISFGVVICQSLEGFVYSNEDNTIPVAIIEPGRAFLINDSENPLAVPRQLLNVSAGARSIFLLPKVSDATNFVKLARNFSLNQKKPPKNLQEQWEIFVDIAQKAKSPWKATVIFFDQTWINKSSLSGYRLYEYLCRNNLPSKSFFGKKIAFDKELSEAIGKFKFKPDPFLTDNIKHIFEIAARFFPGLVFAEDDSLGPIALIQKAFIEHYGLDYSPNILLPGYIGSGKQCYHSMQYPMLLEYSPQQRKESTNLKQLRELYQIMAKAIEHIQNKNSLNGILKEICDVHLEFFHTYAEENMEIVHSKNIKLVDPVVKKQVSQFSFPFCDSSSFLRKGCIAVSNSYVGN